MIAATTNAIHNIPTDMRQYRQFVVWRYEKRDGGKSTKVPYNAKTGRRASVTDIATWVTFDEATAALQSDRWNGAGFVFTKDDPFAGVDLDVSEGEGPNEFQQQTLKKLDSYTELSPSGRGAHIIVRGSVPAGRNNRKAGIEVYSSGRFFTITGNTLGEPKAIAERNSLVNELWTEIGSQHHPIIPHSDPCSSQVLCDDEVVDRIRASEANKRNYEGQVSDWSAAYFALICAASLFSSDETQVRRVVMASPLVQEAQAKGSETRARKAERLWTREYALAAQRGAQERQEAAAGVDHGRQVAHSILAAQKAQGNSAVQSRFKVQHVAHIEFRDPDFIIGDLIESQSCVVIFGASGSGKSFITLDIAACIASKHKFHSKEVQQGCAVYVAAEGGAGIKRRLQAWSMHTGEPLDEAQPLYIIQSPIEMLNAADVATACDAISEATSAFDIKLIVLDTLARNFGDGDENSTGDMNRFIAAVDRMIKRFNCTVIIVHHSGHGDNSRGRGSSALRAAADAEFRVEKKHEIITLTHTKAKDAPENTPMKFKLESVEIGMGKNYEAFTSAVLIELQGTSVQATKLTPSQQRAMKAFEQAGKTHGSFSEEGSFIGVHRDDWRAAFYTIATQDNDDSKSKAFRRACVDLVNIHELEVSDDIFTHTGPLAWVKNQAITATRTAGQPDRTRTLLDRSRQQDRELLGQTGHPL